MSSAKTSQLGLAKVFVTHELDQHPATASDYRREMLAIQELAVRMADRPDDILPRFVDLALEIAGGVSGGISLYEADPAPGVFRWRYLRGTLSRFEGATTPRDFSPCGVTLDQNGPTLCVHPERVYDWIAEAGIVVPEVLLAPLYLAGASPLGTLWIISDTIGHFNRAHARSMTELASFVGIALRMLNTERQLESDLEAQETLSKEIGHRVKNLFTVIDSLIRVSARSALGKQEMATALSGRVHALAGAHSLVSRNLREVGRAARTGDMAELIRAVVLPHEHGDAPSRFSIDGPRIQCGDRPMNDIALIFHELTTNAAKYGALSNAVGSVAVRWREDGDNLVFSWTERGGPTIASPPDHEGFGSTLVTRTVIGQFGGDLTREWKSEGLEMTMRVQLKRVAL